MTTKLSERLKKKREQRKERDKISKDTSVSGITTDETSQINETTSTEIRVPAADIVNSYDFSVQKKLPYKEIEPSRCRPWDHHNRSQLWLTPEKARSLSDSIRSIGQQELGLVRQLDGDPDFDYEIIYGVRRWYACSLIPNQKFRAKVTQEDDSNCAKLMHFENEESRDISEIEKALSYRHQIKHKLFSTQKELARELQISEALLTRFLKGAKLFEEPLLSDLLSPYLLEVTIKSASDLFDLIKQPEVKAVVLEKANALLDDEDALSDLNGKTIVQMLKRTAIETKDGHTEIKAPQSKPFKVNRMPNGDFKIILNHTVNDFSDQSKLQTLLANIVETISGGT